MHDNSAMELLFGTSLHVIISHLKWDPSSSETHSTLYLPPEE